MPLVRRGLTSSSLLVCGVISKLTLLLVLAAPVKRKGARGEVRFPGDPATTCPVLFKGSRSLLLLACCYVPIGGRMLIFKGGTWPSGLRAVIVVRVRHCLSVLLYAGLSMFTCCRALLISGCTRLPMRITLHGGA